MATFTKRGDKWRFQVRLGKHRGAKKKSGTFKRKIDAEAWADKIERNTEQGGLGDLAPTGTVAELIAFYETERGPTLR